MSASDNPLASVAIPLRNRPEYLRPAFAGALRNGHGYLEIIAAPAGGSGSNLGAGEAFAKSRILNHRNEIRLRIIGTDIQVLRKPVEGGLVAVFNESEASEPILIAEMASQLVRNVEMMLAGFPHCLIEDRGRLHRAVNGNQRRRCRRDSLAPGPRRVRHRSFDNGGGAGTAKRGSVVRSGALHVLRSLHPQWRS